MNGWQRLWVLVTTLLGVGAVVAYIHDFPSSVRIDATYSNAISKANEAEQWDQFADAPPIGQKKGTFDDLIPKKSEAQLKEEARVKYDKVRLDARVKYDSELSELSKKRLRLTVVALVGWLLISSSLYGLGWMINWVYQGFRPKKG